MKEELTAREWEIAMAILRYLEKHAEAKDTIEGIAQWWLLREGSQIRLTDVERAVAWLVAQGLVLETRRAGLPPYYQLTPQEHRETGDRLYNLAFGLPKNGDSE